MRDRGGASRVPSGVLRVLGVHTGSAREAREHQGADPEAKGGAVTIPVYRRRHRGTERGRATFPGHAGRGGGEAAGGREAWLQMVPLGRAERLAPSCPFATRRAAPALLRPRQQGPGPVRPKAQAPWLGGRHLISAPRRPELSAERSPPASPASSGAWTCAVLPRGPLPRVRARAAASRASCSTEVRLPPLHRPHGCILSNVCKATSQPRACPSV